MPQQRKKVRVSLLLLRLTGWRRIIFQALLWTCVGANFCIFFSLLLPAHRIEGIAGVHSLYWDLPATVQCIAPAAGLFALVNRMKGWLGAGILAGGVSLGSAYLTFVSAALLHWDDGQITLLIGQYVFWFVTALAAAAGVLLIASEPWLRIKQRRHLEATDTVFPTARVVT